MVGRSGGFVRKLLFLLSGPLVWFIYFGVIYGAVGFGGALGHAPAGIRFFAWGATLAASAALIAIFRHARARRASAKENDPRAIHEITASLAALSLFAVLVEALALLIVPL
jgi:hypothetical protein